MTRNIYIVVHIPNAKPFKEINPGSTGEYDKLVLGNPKVNCSIFYNEEDAAKYQRNLEVKDISKEDDILFLQTLPVDIGLTMAEI